MKEEAKDDPEEEDPAELIVDGSDNNADEDDVAERAPRMAKAVQHAPGRNARGRKRSPMRLAPNTQSQCAGQPPCKKVKPSCSPVIIDRDRQKKTFRLWSEGYKEEFPF